MSSPAEPVSSPAEPVKKCRLWKIVAGVLLIVAILIAIGAGLVAVQPSEFRVSRSTTIAAPPDVVFAQINNLRAWDGWSPWAKLDPNAKNEFSGPEAGTGAAFSWSGNDQIGEGHMMITESLPPELVRLRLEFIRPMPDVADIEFSFQPAGDATSVVWTMKGENSFVEKAFCMLMDLDKLVGGDFEKGLAALKSVAESSAAKPADGEMP